MKTILVLTDFTDKSRRAAAYAFGLAAALNMDLLLFNSYLVPNADMTGVGMAPPFFADYDLYESLSTGQLRKQADSLREEMRGAGSAGPEIRVANSIGTLGDGIRRLMEDEDIALLVMGSKGTEALTHFLYGADTTEVIRRATCPVLLVPPDAGTGQLTRIALAADKPDDRLLKALRYLAGLAAPFRAEIILTHVFPPDTPDTDVNRRLEQLQETASASEYDKISCAGVRGKDISRALVEFTASQGCALIALIHQRHTLYEQVFEESIARKVMGRHRVPCLIFPAGF